MGGVEELLVGGAEVLEPVVLPVDDEVVGLFGEGGLGPALAEFVEDEGGAGAGVEGDDDGVEVADEVGEEGGRVLGGDGGLQAEDHEETLGDGVEDGHDEEVGVGALVGEGAGVDDDEDEEALEQTIGHELEVLDLAVRAAHHQRQHEPLAQLYVPEVAREKRFCLQPLVEEAVGLPGQVGVQGQRLAPQDEEAEHQEPRVESHHHEAQHLRHYELCCHLDLPVHQDLVEAWDAEPRTAQDYQKERQVEPQEPQLGVVLDELGQTPQAQKHQPHHKHDYHHLHLLDPAPLPQHVKVGERQHDRLAVEEVVSRVIVVGQVGLDVDGVSLHQVQQEVERDRGAAQEVQNGRDQQQQPLYQSEHIVDDAQAQRLVRNLDAAVVESGVQLVGGVAGAVDGLGEVEQVLHADPEGV